MYLHAYSILKLPILFLLVSSIQAYTSFAYSESIQPQTKMNEAFLVPKSELEHHHLPSTQRSFINLALRQDSLLYMLDGDETNPLFFGIGGPLLAYKRMRWRSFTLWVNGTVGFQMESALSASIYQTQSPSLWYLPNEYIIGVHGGFQFLDGSYREDPYYSYGGNYSYRSVDTSFYGFQIAAYFPRIWIELSFDLSEVTTDDYNQFSSELSLTRIGLSVGCGFL